MIARNRLQEPKKRVRIAVTMKGFFNVELPDEGWPDCVTGQDVCHPLEEQLRNDEADEIDVLNMVPADEGMYIRFEEVER